MIYYHHWEVLVDILLNENKLIDLILSDSHKFDNKKNRNILMCTIKFIKGSQRFDENLQ